MMLSGQNLTVQFTVSGSSGLTDPDATPTAVLVVDGADTATSVTVTKVSTGVYKAACALPSLTTGRCVSVRVSADVAGVPLGAVVFSDVVGVMPDNDSIAGIKAKTDQLAFSGTDVKATLDGETVTVSTNQDKTGYSLTADYDAAKTAASQTSVDTLSGRLTDVRAAKLDNLDAAVSSRLAAADYTAPANADIAAVKAKTDNLAFVGSDVKATLDGEGVTVQTNLDKTGYSLIAAYDAAKTAVTQEALDALLATIAQIPGVVLPPITFVTEETIGTDGDPVGVAPPWAQINAANAAGATLGTMADENGRFVLPLTTGSGVWTLTARAPRYKTTTAIVEV